MTAPKPELDASLYNMLVEARTASGDDAAPATAAAIVNAARDYRHRGETP